MIQNSGNFFRMLILIISRSGSKLRMLIIIISRINSKLGHVGSNTRSLGQILEKPCVHSKGHRFDLKFMEVCQIICQNYSGCAFIVHQRHIS